MKRKKSFLAVAAVCGGMLSAGAPAQAQVAQIECAGASLRSALCGTLRVPVDHAAPDGPRLTLSFARFPARGARAGTIVFLAGGPGEAAISSAGLLARSGGPLAGVRRAYDLVFVDQRGTGRSSPLRCSTAPRGRFPSGASAGELRAAVARCGEELGDARRHYSTAATALDLEEVRRALGVERIIPLGVSYGGQVAGEYLRRFPDRVSAAVLDSTSPVEFIDTMSKLPQLALRRVFREVCFPPGCAGIIGSPVTLVAELSERLRRRPLPGIDASDVHALVLASDLDPLLRVELPAVLQAALERDFAPLRRLLRYAEAGSGADDVNEVRFVATACVEGNQPWNPASDPARREALLDRHLLQARADYAPFPVGAVAANLSATLCVGWPATPRAPLPPGVAGGPDLPVLILAGREDLRTPLENQRRAAAQLPGARVLAVPNAGHSVLAGDLSGCAVEALRVFLARRALQGSCARDARELDLALPYPSSLGEVPRARGRAPEVVERTATAVDLTLRDAVRWAEGAGRARGVRGGRVRLSGNAARLADCELVPGVRVTGALGRRGGQVTVTGRGATGTLRVRPSGRMVGVLDGLRVRYRPLAVIPA
jgi:pimeloyl-ACP methyl ester carboxylesterase